ncbi:bifunctional 3'-5' exonuclease/DNA polymerase [Microbacterium paludicola]|uniref:bifunctional 3'-5' exonuclease/DNA polymerase n=1 Tax=Microbacterium paludicola TaxID=300019 RepID=UPI0009096055|nr:bifunctional 3'-5' exonuclease/DNA polymerase [Microbacterium paludicola]APF33585.1 bifunctional 3'-5' exonuclease/DNA polymerase [Microbacterium paludicola]
MTAVRARWRAVGRRGDGDIDIAVVDAAGAVIERGRVNAGELAGEIAADPDARWIWSDTTAWYHDILAAGVRVARCHDVRLCHAILRDSSLVTDGAKLRAATVWDAAPDDPVSDRDVLFSLEPAADALPHDLDATLAEFARQTRAIESATDPGRLRLLTAAESAGALVAVELHTAGVPWSREVHDAILADALGPRPRPGELPSLVRDLADQVRAALGDPAASLDSQPRLLRSLHRVGVLVESTSKWELRRHDHPVIEPLLAYKRAMRLLSANGWAWMDEWIPTGRFRPVYVPGGVVTGRWASSGGGALQLPRMLRPAVRADPGWQLVVADVAQLEPRILAAMSGDLALADAARGRDLYEGIVARGTVPTRQEAKMALLGAMYGATTGDSGRLVPSLRRAYPRAMALVDDAARVGEEGGSVRTLLGRTSPAPSAGWRDLQADAAEPEASDAIKTLARSRARERGRFTRNFVVQGTAAEWALAWLADLRQRLVSFPSVGDHPVTGRAHLAFFLHDEIIVHTPVEHAEAAAAAVREAADAAGRLLFGSFPLDFLLDVRIAASADKS